MSELSNLNWLEKVQAVQPTVDRLRAEYDIDEVCGGDVYEMLVAMMGRAINNAVDETKLSHRRKKRITQKMGRRLLEGAVAAFILGYDAGYETGRQNLKDETPPGRDYA